MSTKPVVVQLFYADWCGHCQHFKPEWAKFKSLADKAGIKHEEYEADKDKQKVEESDVNGFPTIKINKEDYNGPRTAEAILAYIKGDTATVGGEYNQCGGGKRKHPKKSLNPDHPNYYKIKYFKYKTKYLKKKYEN